MIYKKSLKIKKIDIIFSIKYRKYIRNIFLK